ncbi:OLC1v1008446C4 [Oldenlandia corymbosa var. corymbosa]|nr:OLC1v1008446C4 [Oldenlandia corymbosa var. corymbosa]
MRTLSHKLSEALVNIRAKEDLVKQHAKVAEEAVSGWEKAEAEVLVLKRHIEVTTQKNAALEERVLHLDGALKECLRQLRNAKEEHEQKIHDAITQRNVEFESMQSELKNQLTELRAQLETAKTEAVTSTFPDLCIKLEAAERDNSSLKLQLISREEELKLRITERDLSIHAAETTSKQYLESIKKVAKLEAECRRVKMLARKAATINDHRSVSSVCVESFTDSQSDCGEGLLAIDNESCKMSCMEIGHGEPGVSDLLASTSKAEMDLGKNVKSLGRNVMVPSDEIDLMNDFLEMERLAAHPAADERIFPDSASHNGESELKAILNRTADLEEELERMEKERNELKMSLSECQHQLQASKDQLEEKEMMLIELKIQLVSANEIKKATEAELQATKSRLEKSCKELTRAEDSLSELENKLATLYQEKESVETDLMATSEKLLKLTKCIEEEKNTVAELSTQLAAAHHLSSKVQEELEATNRKKEAAESRVKVAELELQTLKSTIYTLEEDIQKERALSGQAIANCQKLDAEISRLKSDSLHSRTASYGEFKANQDKELALAASKFAECQKTIASLGQKLNYLARLDDFMIDSEKSTEIY